MAHARKQIRDAIVTALTDLPSTGNNITTSRIIPHEGAKLPAISVYTKNELSEPMTLSVSRRMKRVVNVVVDVAIKASNSLDDAVDAIAVSIEQAMATDTSLQNLVKSVTLTETDVQFNFEGDQRMAFMVMNYAIEYQISETDPETFI